MLHDTVGFAGRILACADCGHVASALPLPPLPLPPLPPPMLHVGSSCCSRCTLHCTCLSYCSCMIVINGEPRAAVACHPTGKAIGAIARVKREIVKTQAQWGTSKVAVELHPGARRHALLPAACSLPPVAQTRCTCASRNRRARDAGCRTWHNIIARDLIARVERA